MVAFPPPNYLLLLSSCAGSFEGATPGSDMKSLFHLCIISWWMAQSWWPKKSTAWWFWNVRNLSFLVFASSDLGWFTWDFLRPCGRKMAQEMGWRWVLPCFAHRTSPKKRLSHDARAFFQSFQPSDDPSAVVKKIPAPGKIATGEGSSTWESRFELQDWG